jgi:hypothetical protein
VLGNGTFELGAAIPETLMPFFNRLFAPVVLPFLHILTSSSDPAESADIW